MLGLNRNQSSTECGYRQLIKQLLRNPIFLFILISAYLSYSIESIHNQSFMIYAHAEYFFFGMFIIFNILILLFSLSGRAGFSFCISFAVLLIFACISFFKYASRGEPLYYGDLAVAFQINGVTDSSNLIITRYIVLAAISGIALSIVLFFVKFPNLTRQMRLVYFLTASLSLFYTYNSNNIPWNKATDYVKMGFVSGFLHSMHNSGDAQGSFAMGDPTAGLPQGNTEHTNELQANPEKYIMEALDRIKAKIPEDRVIAEEKPDVILLLSESFWDITRIKKLSLSEDPIPNFRRISNECISGDMLSYTFGGGTAHVEFEVLTGYLNRFLNIGDTAYQALIKDETMSLAHIFKQNGYETLGIHTYDRTFYSRDKVYPLLGFDQWIGIEDFESFTYSGKYVSDQTLTDEVIKHLERDGDPKFIMAISMENHQPYPENKYPEKSVKVLNTDMMRYYSSKLESYMHGLHNADIQLGRLVEYLEKTNRPTTLLFFGDHQPTLGANFWLYRYAGKLADPTNRTLENYREYLTTDFLLWSNYRKESGKVEAIGENFIGNYLLNYLQMPKPLYYYFLDDVYESSFHFLSRPEMLMDEHNNLHGTMSIEQRQTYDMYRALQMSLLGEDTPIKQALSQLY